MKLGETNKTLLDLSQRISLGKKEDRNGEKISPVVPPKYITYRMLYAECLGREQIPPITKEEKKTLSTFKNNTSKSIGVQILLNSKLYELERVIWWGKWYETFSPVSSSVNQARTRIERLYSILIPIRNGLLSLMRSHKKYTAEDFEFWTKKVIIYDISDVVNANEETRQPGFIRQVQRGGAFDFNKARDNLIEKIKKTSSYITDVKMRKMAEDSLALYLPLRNVKSLKPVKTALPAQKMRVVVNDAMDIDDGDKGKGYITKARRLTDAQVRKARVAIRKPEKMTVQEKDTYVYYLIYDERVIQARAEQAEPFERVESRRLRKEEYDLRRQRQYQEQQGRRRDDPGTFKFAEPFKPTQKQDEFRDLQEKAFKAHEEQAEREAKQQQAEREAPKPQPAPAARAATQSPPKAAPKPQPRAAPQPTPQPTPPPRAATQSPPKPQPRAATQPTPAPQSPPGAATRAATRAVPATPAVDTHNDLNLGSLKMWDAISSNTQLRWDNISGIQGIVGSDNNIIASVMLFLYLRDNKNTILNLKSMHFGYSKLDYMYLIDGFKRDVFNTSATRLIGDEFFKTKDDGSKVYSISRVTLLRQRLNRVFFFLAKYHNVDYYFGYRRSRGEGYDYAKEIGLTDEEFKEILQTARANDANMTVMPDALVKARSRRLRQTHPDKVDTGGKNVNFKEFSDMYKSFLGWYSDLKKHPALLNAGEIYFHPVKHQDVDWDKYDDNEAYKSLFD